MKEVPFSTLRPRELRARNLASLITKELDELMAPSLRNRIWAQLYDLFYREGVEILTDHDRQSVKLPVRNGDGWTTEELFALEKFRVQALYGPISITVKTTPSSKMEEAQ